MDYLQLREGFRISLILIFLLPRFILAISLQTTREVYQQEQILYITSREREKEMLSFPVCTPLGLKESLISIVVFGCCLWTCSQYTRTGKRIDSFVVVWHIRAWVVSWFVNLNRMSCMPIYDKFVLLILYCCGLIMESLCASATMQCFMSH